MHADGVERRGMSAAETHVKVGSLSRSRPQGLRALQPVRWQLTASAPPAAVARLISGFQVHCQ